VSRLALHDVSSIASADAGIPGMRFDADVIASLELPPHFVCWNLEPRPGDPKPAKVPKQPRTGLNASSTEPSHWASLDEAVRRAEREGWGIGFVFHATLNVYAGVDLDACRDPQTGLLVPWAQSIVNAFDSYSEASPSGTGVHILVRGKPRHNGRKAGAGGTAVECYGHARYFCLTGWAL